MASSPFSSAPVHTDVKWQQLTAILVEHRVVVLDEGATDLLDLARHLNRPTAAGAAAAAGRGQRSAQQVSGRRPSALRQPQPCQHASSAELHCNALHCTGTATDRMSGCASPAAIRSELLASASASAATSRCQRSSVMHSYMQFQLYAP